MDAELLGSRCLRASVFPLVLLEDLCAASDLTGVLYMQNMYSDNCSLMIKDPLLSLQSFGSSP